ncbi:hypothetical protein PRK78_003547 [Emydomyces testavorans]|uniref:F-box domain-containing protein n=1 Tax=Emydomyces testavorans TaxID=2070801 RepID=A0AAF0DGF0_9EURO|nr:hypothetical protein PRK78_003547 [Emydomyces testavorans]
MAVMAEKPDPSSVMRIPEILLNIFKYLDGYPVTLLSVLRVNKTWFDCGASVAWKTATVSTLAAASEENRHVYASKIHHLSFNGGVDSAQHEKFKDLEFTNLRSISIDAYRPKDGKVYLQQYLRPTLEGIFIYGSDLDPEFFTTMQAQCRRLREITLDSPGNKLNSEQFLSFLKGCPSLQAMKFMYGMDGIINDDIVTHLASRDNLQTLALGRVINSEMMERLLETVPAPFENIKSLTLSVTSAAFRLLTPHISSVTTLELIAKDNEHSVLELVSTLKNLRRLTVNYATNTNLMSTELLSLKNLPNLEAISLNGVQQEIDNFNLDCFQFTDTDFDNLLLHLPRLLSLNFGVQCMLTSVALKTVAKRCPLLDSLQILVPIDSSIIRPETPEQKPMLPELQTLDLAGFERPADVPLNDKEAAIAAAKTIATHFAHQFPKLRELFFMGDDPFSDRLAREFDRLIGRNADRGYDDPELTDDEAEGEGEATQSVAVEETFRGLDELTEAGEEANEGDDVIIYIP